MLEGGCTGANACAASATSCSKESLFGEGETGVLWLTLAVTCNRKVSGIQLELQMWWLKPETKKYEMLYHNGSSKNLLGEFGSDTSRAASLIKHICSEGYTYKAWVWAYAWGTNYTFKGRAEPSGAWQCEGNWAVYAAEFVEFLDSYLLRKKWGSEAGVSSGLLVRISCR